MYIYHYICLVYYLSGIVLLCKVPLELVYKAVVTNVNVELDHDPLVSLLLQQVVRLTWKTFQLKMYLGKMKKLCCFE